MTEAKEQYNQQGFYVARSLLPSNKVNNLYLGIDNMVSDQLGLIDLPAGSLPLLDKLESLLNHDIDRYKKVVGSLWRMYECFELMHDSTITDFIKYNFGWRTLMVPGGQVILLMAEELKIPGGYFGFSPHQDFPSIQGSLDGIVIWTPLTDIDTENYPLEVIPGSHLKGLYPSIEHNDSTWEVSKEAYSESEFVPVEVNVGDVIFMSYFTVHRTSARGTKGKLRIAASTRFDNPDEKTYQNRAYPTAYNRTVQRSQFVSGFPSPAQVKEVYTNNKV